MASQDPTKKSTSSSTGDGDDNIDDEDIIDDDMDIFTAPTTPKPVVRVSEQHDLTLNVHWGELRLTLAISSTATIAQLVDMLSEALSVPRAKITVQAPQFPALGPSVLLAVLVNNGATIRIEGEPSSGLLALVGGTTSPSAATSNRSGASSHEMHGHGRRNDQHLQLVRLMEELRPPAQFTRLLQSTYSLTALPRIQAEGFRSAVSAASQQAKLLLLYLHCPSQETTVPFLCGCLAAPALVSYIDDHFMFWIALLEKDGSMVTKDQLLAQLALPPVFPILGVVAYLSGSISVLDVIQGPAALNPDELLVRLMNAFDQHSPLLAAHRNPANTEGSNTQILDEQNAAYEESLAQDRRKAELAAEEALKQTAEEERVQREQQQKLQEEERQATELKQRQALRANAVPAEPAAGTKDATSIAIRFPDGSRVQRRFLKSNTLQALFDFVDGAAHFATEAYTFATTMPKQTFSRSQAGSSLEELHLHPQAMLHVQKS